MYTVALIGCGRISYKHIEAILKNKSHLKLTACCDPIIERACEKVNEYHKVFPATPVAVYTDYRKMLEKDHPDICVIATESGYHARITIDCLESGSHVICEKPMALSIDDAKSMIEVAKHEDKKLAVCFQNRFNKPIQQTRVAYEAGRFGRMLHGMIQVRWNRNESYYAQAPWRGTWLLDGGTLMNQCTHGIDLLQWMMGEDAIRVHAITRRFIRPIQAEDFGAAIVEFKSGAVGIIEGTATVYPSNLNETLSLFGTKGTVVIGGLATNKLDTWRFSDAAEVGDLEGKILKHDESEPPNVYGYGHAQLYADVLDAIETGKEPLVSGEKGILALQIILGIYKSQKTGEPVDLPCIFSTSAMEGYFDL